jgi:hypothetical protein
MAAGQESANRLGVQKVSPAHHIKARKGGAFLLVATYVCVRCVFVQYLCVTMHTLGGGRACVRMCVRACVCCVCACVRCACVCVCVCLHSLAQALRIAVR